MICFRPICIEIIILSAMAFKHFASGKYRLKSVFTVYAGNKSETITKYSSEKTV